MKHFSALLSELDSTKNPDKRLDFILKYLMNASRESASLGLALLLDHKLCKLINSKDLKKCLSQKLGIESWLFEESYKAVGDLAETIALLVGSHSIDRVPDTLDTLITKINRISIQDAEVVNDFILEQLLHLDYWSRFAFVKIITSSFNYGVSKRLIINACALHFNIPETVVESRLASNWDPINVSLAKRLSVSKLQIDISTPYPFLLGHILKGGPEALGDCKQYFAEYKWSGVRAQIIKRQGQFFIWGRQENLLTDFFPDIIEEIINLPDSIVLDGQIAAFSNMPLSYLQKRLAQAKPSARLQKEAPCKFITYDLVEFEGQDLRSRTLIDRRVILEKIPELKISPILQFDTWDDLYSQRFLARELGAEGLMLKRKDSLYLEGRKKSLWWKWKLDPFSIHAILISAKKEHSKRANIYTDYTFAVWKDKILVPIARADLGLEEKELAEINRFITSNTREKFGPVRTVKPDLVFEIVFEGLQTSKRHKSGVLLRESKILRWVKEKQSADANTLQELLELITK